MLNKSSCLQKILEGTQMEDKDKCGGRKQTSAKVQPRAKKSLAKKHS